MTYPKHLDDLGIKHGTDKSSRVHDYLSFYEERLSYLKDETFVFFEIGVHEGASLRTWAEYFTKATIVGIDIVPETKRHEGENRYVDIGDASRLETIDEAVRRYGRPLIVLDDGSHLWHHQIETLQHAWPRILSGGMFIMEDLHTSFAGFLKEQPGYEGLSEISTYDYILKLNRRLVGRSYASDEREADGFIAECAPTVRSIEWHPQTCIIRKLS